MSVFKVYNGKRITSRHPKYKTARWWVYKRIKGHKTLHQSIPEARTQEQAEQAERKLIDEVFAGKYGKGKNPTFEEFVNNVYLLKYVPQKNINVYVKKIFCRELVAHFGKMRLRDITPQDCRDYQNTRLKTPTKYKTQRANASVNKEMSTLARIFTYAMEQNVLAETPMRFVKKLDVPDARHFLLTDNQKASLWNELEKDQYLFRFVALATNLPLRKGQLLAITEGAIDFERGILWVIASKGKKPRYVPLNATATAILRAMVAEGKFFDTKYFEKRWRHALLNAGINKKGGTRETNYHLHDLRVWFGSELHRRGASPYHIQELFAHSDMSTSAIYIKSADEDLSEVVKRLDPPEITDVLQ